MRREAFIGRSLGLKAHAVVKVEEREAEGERELLIYVERLGQSPLRGVRAPGPAGGADPPARAPVAGPGDSHPHSLVGLRPVSRVVRACGLRVERIPWAELWHRAPAGAEPGEELLHRGGTPVPGILAWTRIRVINGALEGMNNKIKQISHRAFGYRTTWAYIAKIYHSCAALPLP
jgi:Transposase